MPNQTMVYSCSGAEQEYTMVWFGIFLYFLIFSLKIRFCEQSVLAKSPLLKLSSNFKCSSKYLVLYQKFFSTFAPWGPTGSYGNCFVFNFQLAKSTSESVSMPGPGYGLTLVLNIEQEEYGGITQAEGARWVLLQNVAWLNLKTCCIYQGCNSSKRRNAND